VHRIGRTARADQKGEAITLVSPKEQHKFQRIEQLIGKKVDRLPVPEALGEAPIFDPNIRSARPPRAGGNSNHPKSGGGKRKFFKRKPKQ
jgi:superfamily II DNA/RNA helicase